MRHFETSIALPLLMLGALGMMACSDGTSAATGAEPCASTTSSSSSSMSSSTGSSTSSSTSSSTGASTGSGESPVVEGQFTPENWLIRPEDYREWVYVSSGLGMSYNDGNPQGENPPFDNVFVAPPAYQAFKETGKWPEKTIFVLEVRASTSKGSILKQGRFQREILSIEAEVKDTARFPDTWAYFNFGQPDGSLAGVASAQPKDGCFACHTKNAAVENTFVQFFPTLFPIAENHGTLRTDYPK